MRVRLMGPGVADLQPFQGLGKACRLFFSESFQDMQRRRQYSRNSQKHPTQLPSIIPIGLGDERGYSRNNHTPPLWAINRAMMKKKPLLFSSTKTEWEAVERRISSRYWREPPVGLQRGGVRPNDGDFLNRARFPCCGAAEMLV